MKKRFRNFLLMTFFWLVLIISFFFFAALIVLKANGYQLNTRRWEVIKTGMIVLNGQPKNVTIKMGSKTLKDGFPTHISNLNQGSYQITITAPGFQTWSKSIRVEPGLASTYENILLFSSSPEDVNDISGATLDDIKNQTEDAKKDIVVNDSEVDYQFQMVTRFSQTISQAVLYPDRRHILFQVGNEVRIIDIDGSNNKLLFKLSNSETTYFAFRNDGATIFYIDNSQIKAKKVR